MGKIKNKKIENQQKEIDSYGFHDEREKAVLTVTISPGGRLYDLLTLSHSNRIYLFICFTSKRLINDQKTIDLRELLS